MEFIVFAFVVELCVHLQRRGARARVEYLVNYVMPPVDAKYDIPMAPADVYWPHEVVVTFMQALHDSGL